MPNGEYKATVDFGESIVRADIRGASVACEVEGELVCPGMAIGETDCIFLDEPVIVTDGFFTITGTLSVGLARHVLTFGIGFEVLPVLNIDWVVRWSVAVHLDCRLLSRHWRVSLCEPGAAGTR